MKRANGVAKALFVPVAARVYVSERFPEYFYDARSVALARALPDDGAEAESTEYTMLTAAARYYLLDATVRGFMAQHERCNVVSLGAGMETMYFRLRNGRARFYEVDLPEVIEARREWLGEYEDEVLVAGDIFALAWLDAMDLRLPTLFVAAELFPYFRERDVVQLVRSLRERCPHGELACDGLNEQGLRLMNRYGRRSGQAAGAMYFPLNDAADFAAKCGAALVSSRPFFEEAHRLLAERLGPYTQLAMWLADQAGVLKMLHLRLSPATVP